MQESVLEKIRREYQPKTPAILTEDFSRIKAIKGNMSQSAANQQELKALFSNTYGMPVVKFEKGQSEAAAKKMKAGVILSGGQAAGGHNVIAGIFDGLKKACAESQLYGFLNGPAGLIEGKYIEINEKMLSAYRNTGGFDIIGSGRTKIETSEQISSSIETAEKLGLDAIIIIGGDDSNTNAALLAEHFINAKLPTRVIGVPKTIDGDLKNDMIEVSFGFDTATKTYSELIGNIERDANSSKKYWHFIKLMGRSASHIALECALQTAPNICLISEEVEAKKMTLKQITSEIASVIVKRAENGDNFGVILIPEGVIEFIPDVKILISDLNNLMADHNNEFSQLKTFSAQTEWLANKLGKEEYNLFKMLPETIAEQLLLDRDPHGNVQVSRIETEKLLIELLSKELAQLKAEGKYKGKFSSYAHFFGYEGRSAFPSNFDADYCYSLGVTAFLLAANGFTGYIAAIQNLIAAPEQWTAGGVPLTMMNMEMRHGKEKPVIKKALVDLNGKPFQAWVKKREQAAVKTSFTYPGAIQYFGPDELCGRPTETLLLERKE